MEKEYAEKGDLLAVMILILLVVVGTLFAIITVCKWYYEIIDRQYQPMYCIPHITETFRGDIYTFRCYSKEEFDEIYNTDITPDSTDTI